LIVGGGVIADVGGLACSLYHRNTPYVMLATSIVSGIDAGPSPRTCCDGFGFKNLFGAYHAPVMTLTDRTFFKTLRTGWIRHGVAEIIKMAVVKNKELFHLLEDTGFDLITSQFGTNTDDALLSEKGQRVLALAMCSYVEAEYDNLYETNQCRPHAYGHTWSPGYEIPSGMLHGHAVACGMGLGAHMSYLQGWISEEDRNRIMQLISNFELSLWHPILDNVELIYKAQIKVIEKRGGNLVAPLPKGEIGQCGYLNELPFEEMKQVVSSYKAICQSYPRNGLGVEAHCKDVGLEDPSTVGHLSIGDMKAAVVN
jgi:3-dehydroquinate synthase